MKNKYVPVTFLGAEICFGNTHLKHHFQHQNFAKVFDINLD
jgi:hypothetical protein